MSSVIVEHELHLKTLRGVFDIFDVDRDGKISNLDLSASMTKIGHRLTSTETITMMKPFDRNGDYNMYDEDFLDLMVQPRKHHGSAYEREAREVFQEHDTDSDGFVSQEQLLECLKKLGVEFSSNDLDTLLNKTGADGLLSYEAFQVLMSCKNTFQFLFLDTLLPDAAPSVFSLL